MHRLIDLEEIFQTTRWCVFFCVQRAISIPVR